MSEELLRLRDTIHRDKGIDQEILFEAIESALLSAARKRFDADSDVTIRVNRQTGDMEALENGEPVQLPDFGRIAAHTAKQVMTQKIREAERDVVYGEYSDKVDQIVSGICQRFERGSLIVNLGRTEGIIPRREQVFNESYHTGERIRAYVLSVEPRGQKVSIVLSRTHPGLVRELFALEVPEISERVVEIKNVVREPGHRTKIAVASNDMKVDPIGACVGVRGTRIRSIVAELNGEKIDIVRWNESAEIFISNALSPAEIITVELDRDAGRARVVVAEDQLSLAIGRRGQNVRLTAKLTGWNVDVMTEHEAREHKQIMIREFGRLPEVLEEITEEDIEAMKEAGFSSLEAITHKGLKLLVATECVDEQKTELVYDYAVKRIAELEEERAERERARREEKKQAEAKAAEAEESAAAEGEEALEEGTAAEGEEALEEGTAAEGEEVSEEGDAVKGEGEAGQAPADDMEDVGEVREETKTGE